MMLFIHISYMYILQYGFRLQTHIPSEILLEGIFVILDNLKGDNPVQGL